MSVIAALISTRDGIVASDGRQFASVYLINGIPIAPPNILSNNYDKTFSLGGRKVVGAFCGLLEFSGATVAEHIRDIADSAVSGGTSLIQIVDLIERELAGRLNRADPNEVIPTNRNIDLLLVGGLQLSRAQMRIVAIRFICLANGVTPSREILSADNRNRFYVFGEDLARTAASKSLYDIHVAGRDPKFLMEITREAINEGILKCGIKEHAVHHACGGNIFSLRTWY
jgi:hypothetical protein